MNWATYIIKWIGEGGKEISENLSRGKNIESTKERTKQETTASIIDSISIQEQRKKLKEQKRKNKIALIIIISVVVVIIIFSVIIIIKKKNK